MSRRVYIIWTWLVLMSDDGEHENLVRLVYIYRSPVGGSSLRKESFGCCIICKRGVDEIVLKCTHYARKCDFS